MNPTDKMMAWAQIAITMLFLTFVFVATVLYELGKTHLGVDQEKNFGNTMNWYQGAALIIIYFWFQRTRTAGIPDGSSVITQVHESPDGSKTTITSPAASKAPVPVATGVSNANAIPAPADPAAGA